MQDFSDGIGFRYGIGMLVAILMKLIVSSWLERTGHCAECGQALEGLISKQGEGKK